MAQAIFTKTGFSIEQPTTPFEYRLKNEPFRTLYEQGFAERISKTDPSIDYLLQVAQSFVHQLKKRRRNRNYP